MSLRKNDVSITEVTLPVVGYLAVVFACLLGGNILRVGSFVLPSNDQILFWILLIPFYLNRVIIYERQEDHHLTDKSLIVLSLQLPITVLIFVLCTYFYILPFNLTLEKLVFDLSAVLPLYLLSIRAYRKRTKGETKELFRFYIFFPALCTCMIPFIFGYLNYSNYLELLCTILIILTYWGFSLLGKALLIIDYFFAIIASLIIIVSVFFIEHITKNIEVQDFFKVFSIGLILTLVMGLTESWWFVKDKNNFHSYDQETQDVYMSSVHIATAQIPFLLPLIFLFPHSNLVSLFLFIYSAVLYITWFYFNSLKRWRRVRFFYGIVAPFTCFCFVDHDFVKDSLKEFTKLFVPNPHDVYLLMTNNEAAIAIAIGLALSLFVMAHTRVKGSQFEEKYYTVSLLYVCFIIYLGLSLDYIVSFKSLVPISSNEAKFLLKTKVLIVYYLLIIIIIFLKFMSSLRPNRYKLIKTPEKSTNENT